MQSGIIAEFYQRTHKIRSLHYLHEEKKCLENTYKRH